MIALITDSTFFSDECSNSAGWTSTALGISDASNCHGEQARTNSISARPFSVNSERSEFLCCAGLRVRVFVSLDAPWCFDYGYESGRSQILDEQGAKVDVKFAC